MRKRITAAWIGLLAAFFTGLASASTILELRHDLCLKESVASKIVMESRQSGMPMTEVMSAVVDTYRGHKDAPMRVDEVRRAYEVPRFNTSSDQVQAVADFESDAYSVCLKKFS